MEEHPPVPPMREHRLYQMDWLKRIYRYSNDELDLAFDPGGFLPLDEDPKTAIALQNLDTFPVDLNTASQELLLRVPGLGPTSAQRIIDNRATPQHRQLARPAGHGRGAQAGLALRNLPRPAPTLRQATAPGLVSRGSQGGSAIGAPYRGLLAMQPRPCGLASSCDGLCVEGDTGAPGVGERI